MSQDNPTPNLHIEFGSRMKSTGQMVQFFYIQSGTIERGSKLEVLRQAKAEFEAALEVIQEWLRETVAAESIT